MMQTTSRRAQTLKTDAIRAYGLSHPALLFYRLQFIKEEIFASRPRVRLLTITPYLNDGWGIFWTNRLGQKFWQPIAPSDLLDLDVCLRQIDASDPKPSRRLLSPFAK